MRTLSVFILVFCLLSLSGSSRADKQQSKSGAPDKQPAENQRGTETSPLVVKVAPAPKTQEETNQDAQARLQKDANDRNLVRITGVLAFIGFLQLLVFGYQAFKLKETVKASADQSEAMERHISEAARSAIAMETIAAIIQTGNRAVMRAYLTVNIGSGSYQERNRIGQPDVKFAIYPTVTNTGNTHARHVRIRKKAAFFPSTLPQNFTYGELGPETADPFATVAAHQGYTIHAIVDDFVSEADAARIKVGEGRILHALGEITYEDIFGETHTTRFGQSVIFAPPNNQILGWYTPGQNDADQPCHG